MRAGLTAELAAVSAEIAGLEAPIPAPATEDHYIGRRDPMGATRYPVVFYPGASTKADPAGQYGGMESAQLVPLRLDMVVALRNQKPEQLELWCTGWSDAIFNLVATDPSLGGICDEASIEYLDWEHGDQGVAAVVATIVLNKESRT